jgi:hypothetical protein
MYKYRADILFSTGNTIYWSSKYVLTLYILQLTKLYANVAGQNPPRVVAPIEEEDMLLLYVF